MPALQEQAGTGILHGHWMAQRIVPIRLSLWVSAYGGESRLSLGATAKIGVKGPDPLLCFKRRMKINTPNILYRYE